ncbi:thrombospondin-like protein [Sarcoptes scabiei]|nr:thrombospondin-like protein [Sarcoptes scabiei]
MQNRGEQLNRQIDPLQFGSCRTNSLCCSGRDSRCSVLMPMSTQSIQRRSSRDSISLFGNLLETSNAPLKECYCDGACITLGDCCADYKETCGVQDCIVSDWKPWSECDSQCGIGTMNRSRVIIQNAQNGGKECPELNQRRACQGQNCQVKDEEKLLREMAIILPSSFSTHRTVDETKDIRRNLRLNYPKDPLKDNINEYCVSFEIIKSQKSCEILQDNNFASKLQPGSQICVYCQEAAMRSHLGYRCTGHGIDTKPTRWSIFNQDGCHGKWIRLEKQSVNKGRCFCSKSKINSTLGIGSEADFIFV